MPTKSGRRGARRRETELPQPMAFVNQDRRRRRGGRSPQQRQQRMEHLMEEESSVIMLSSAENTMMPVAGDNQGDESSVLMTSVRRSGRRSTRLTDVDMMLDETDIGMQSRTSKSITSDGTNMSIINVDQTTMIERERAKSSVLPRYTRSKSLAPPAGGEEAADGIRRSSIFSMVTKRNRRRARSVVRSSTTREEMVRGNTSPGARNPPEAGQGMDLSKISEEQSNSSAMESVARTPKPIVKELVIQTRSMLKKGKRWSPAQSKTKSPSKAQLAKPAKEKDGSKNKRTRKRKQKELNAEVSEELPEKELGKSTPAEEITPLVTSVSRRKHKELNLEQQTEEEAPTVDANQNVSSVSTDKAQLEQSTRSQKEPEADKSIANSATSQMESSSDQSRTNPCDISQFSNVAKRKRPKPMPDKDLETRKKPTTPEKSVHEASVSEPEPALKRARTRSVSRARQPTQELKKSKETRGRGRARSTSRSRQAALQKVNVTIPEPENPIQTHNREKSVHESSIPEPEPTTKRARTRSVSRARQPTQVPNKSTENRGRGQTRSASRPRQAALEKANVTTPDPEKPIQAHSRRGRARNRAISESANISRSKSTLRADTTKPKSPSRARSRTRVTKPSLPKPSPGTPSRSKSVPRGVLLSPPPSAANPNHSTSHVPIYRRYAESVLQLNKGVISQVAPIPLPSGADVYVFDQPSQELSTTTTTATGSEDATKKTKGSTANKRPRRATKTPIKHHQHTTVFGTDMGRICSVVKKIGGGPVRRRVEDDDGTAANRNVVHTSTLAAMVQPLQPSNAVNIAPRSPSPTVNTREMAADEDYHQAHPYEMHHDFDEENIPPVELPTPPVSPPRLSLQIQRVMQQKAPPSANTPDKGQPHCSTLNFSPQASSSPWRIQNENILPKTFYFSRSKDLLPSYESDLVVRDENQQPPIATPQDILPAAMEPVHPRRTSPTHQHSFVRPTAAAPSTAVSSAVFKDIQKSYEQLKATSEMSEKLISAMRKCKSNAHNKRAASLGDESTELIAEFRMYEEKMKQAYQKLQQWFKRSQRTLAESMKAIEKTASVPKTPAQQAVVENFRRNSGRFVSMINDLESAMNDSNLENITPPKPVESSGRPPFKDIILTDRNRNDRNRSPLKSLDISNVPPRFSPIKSPLVKASYTSFSGNRTMLQSRSRDRFSKLSLVKPTAVSTETESLSASTAAAPQKSVIEIADTVVAQDQAELNETSKQQPEKDLFGFESDDEQEEQAAVEDLPSVDPTPVKITRETLKDRLQSVRKLLPAPSRFGSASKSGTSQHRSKQNAPKIFNSPKRKRGQSSIQTAFSASTPLAEKQNQSKRQGGEQAPNISAIRASTGGPMVEVEQEEEPTGTARKQESPPAAVFFEPEQEFSAANVSRTYSRVPRRNIRRRPNIYLAKLGISDDEEEVEESASDSDEGKRRKKAKKQRTAMQKKKKKKTVEQSAEFQNFVSEFNSMCDQVNQYQLVIDKPTVQQST